MCVGTKFCYSKINYFDFYWMAFLAVVFGVCSGQASIWILSNSIGCLAGNQCWPQICVLSFSMWSVNACGFGFPKS